MNYIILKLLTYSVLIVNKFVKSAPTKAHNNPFIGFYVFPHGGVILNPETHDFSQEGGRSNGSRNQSLQLHNAMRSAATALIKTNPDVVILSTPHGFYLEDRYLLVGNPSMAGNAGWEWSEFSARFNIDKEDTVNLYLDLIKKENPVELLSFGIGQTEMPLQWGEVIPWYFIQEAATKLDIPLPSVIYIGQPPTKRMKQLNKLGNDIASFVSSSMAVKRVAMVISGDLSHYHANDTNAPYPFNPDSVVFDGFIKQWGQIHRTLETETLSNEVLLNKAEAISDNAGSCGYPALVMMHAIIGNLVQQGMKFKATFYEYQAPTYFGMMVTSWTPQA